ncbi:MAG: LysR family transcriptional regulator [gamma proteobacterium symbiont of Bathyaustriella thionipta]|nr:LysR family transcriptional regulator [gamma proteobacterium symbiont of Bathyaustriella thionipta]
MNITFQQLKTFVTVTDKGSFQAGAAQLNKTHPCVISAIKKLENELGFALFDRSGYRSTLTKEGRAFYHKCHAVLHEMEELKTQALHLRQYEEPELTIAIGDVSPVTQALQVLRGFSRENTHTQLKLLFENLEGADECLLEGRADLIVHHIDQTDPRYEYKPWSTVELVPVAAPGFLKIPLTNRLGYADLETYTQCIIRNTARTLPGKNYFLLEHAAHITVGDQHTKKEIIKQGMAWGHIPLFMVKKELETGQLLSLQSDRLPIQRLDIVVARLQQSHYGIMAERLWQSF